MRILHIDELQEFTLRELDRLKPGAEVLQLHIPDLAEKGWPYDGARSADVSRVKIDAVGLFSAHELEPNAPRFFGDDEKNRSIYTFTQPNGRSGYRFTADAGVTPYSSGVYNNTNSLVLVEDLEEAGVEVVTVPSPEYHAALYADNEARRASAELDYYS